MTRRNTRGTSPSRIRELFWYGLAREGEGSNNAWSMLFIANLRRKPSWLEIRGCGVVFHMRNLLDWGRGDGWTGGIG